MIDRKYVQRTGTFIANSPDGTEYTIHIFTEFVESRTTSGRQVVEGLKHLKTAGGEHVNRIAKGEYQIVGLCETSLASDDPDAP